MIGKEAIERLARALGSSVADRPLFAETLAVALAAGRSDAEALLLERRLVHLAAAAEELGEEATVEAISERAIALEARRT